MVVELPWQASTRTGRSVDRRSRILAVGAVVAALALAAVITVGWPGFALFPSGDAHQLADVVPALEPTASPPQMIVEREVAAPVVVKVAPRDAASDTRPDALVRPTPRPPRQTIAPAKVQRPVIDRQDGRGDGNRRRGSDDGDDRGEGQDNSGRGSRDDDDEDTSGSGGGGDDGEDNSGSGSGDD
jgi:hypothetical protein